ncbi:ABC transporter substrate-binding protein [Nostocaceae cyanobacterium CENA369]|uniref:ABC transporter substrate-binding protein n=1 Tax=Dendronalium phyllosphericum CENA369 TaxID=1725256 RepID=A0A8J7LBG2_9NOST|nr:ABC transporter substrate-binding protein [Dendronalium phyllosphericum]MBH8571807.1 ABC transporter substrate-binding protein [Dendronalium phyllosphericum CENA369]
MVQSPSSLQFPQNVAVVIRISTGSFAEGFTLSLQILEDGRTIQEYNDLPPIPAAPEMLQLYEEWQEISLKHSRALQAVSGQETNVSYADWRQRTTDLRDRCRTWFRHTAFSSLRDRIRANARVRKDQSVPIIIRCSTAFDTENDILRRLPWHLWDLFSHSQLPNAEFALFTNYNRPIAILKAPIRILAIFGSSDGGLQLDKDEAALQILEQRGAEITRISEPSPEILSRLLFDRNWDILFFAGHSSSQGNSGTIQISQGNSLQLDALRQSLTTAVRNGLKLAIFNSCDGLGIADFLTELNVPVVIVMREPVPDRIACEFLLYLLKEFSQGTPLCLAVRKARDRLEDIELKDFPAASWLPVICVSPNQPELVWPTPTPLLRLLLLLRRLLSNLRRFITRFLVSPAQLLLSRLRSYFRRDYLIVLFFATLILVLVFAVGRPIVCQVFPSTCIENFISYGEKQIANSRVKLSPKYFKQKQEGIEQFQKGQYEQAVKTFDKLHPRPKENNEDAPRLSFLDTEEKNALQDPEILIYRNNAFVRNRQKNNPNLPIYTIAVAAPLNIDASIFLGVAQAQDVAVNKKGIDLQVVIANDNNDPAQARQIAEKLYQDKKILAVVGHYTSENTCAALKVYSQQPNPLVVISPTSSVVNLPSKRDIASRWDCGGDPHRVFFRTVSSTRVEAESLVKYFIQGRDQSKRKVVVFRNSKELFSEDLFEQFRSVLEGEMYKGLVIAKFDISDAKFDPSKLPQEIINTADALAVFPDGQTNNDTAFKKAIDIINWNNGKKPILGANTLYVQEILNQPKKTTVDALYLAVDWHPKQCGAQDFADQIRQYWGGDLNRRTALAYEAVQAVLQTIEPNSSVIRTKDIQNKLSQAGIGDKVAASSDAIKGLLISFINEYHDRRQITTRAIVTVSEKKNFILKQDVPCSNVQNVPYLN